MCVSVVEDARLHGGLGTVAVMVIDRGGGVPLEITLWSGLEKKPAALARRLSLVLNSSCTGYEGGSSTLAVRLLETGDRGFFIRPLSKLE